jgi:heptosyltransferase-2
MHQKILVIQPLPGIGDTLWFLPHLKAISAHYGEAGDLYLLTKKRSKADQILGGMVPLKKILWVDRQKEHRGVFGFWRLIKMLKRHRFDTVWILHKSPRYALACWLAGIINIFGYGASFSKWIVTPPVLTKDDWGLHPIERASALLSAHQIKMPEAKLTPISSLKTLMTKRYGFKKLKKIPIVLGIGGSEVYKKWPPQFFAELAYALYQKGYDVFVLGGAQEKREALLIQSLVQEKGGDVTPVYDLSLQEAFAFLSCMTLFVGNDTGMLNAAAYSGIKTFGIFVKTPPLTYCPNLHSITPMAASDDATIGDVSVDQVLNRIEEKT